MRQAELIAPEIYAGLNIKQQKSIESMQRGNVAGTIIKSVCEVLKVKLKEVKSPKRTRELSEARSIAIALILQKYPNFGLKKLGLVFNRDHSTILYSKELFNELRYTNKSFKDKVDLVIKTLD